jgi:hypothetical protein
MSRSAHARLKIALDQRGGIRCHGCGKRLNRKNIVYKPKVYPMGTAEMIPVCQKCVDANVIGDDAGEGVSGDV